MPAAGLGESAERGAPGSPREPPEQRPHVMSQDFLTILMFLLFGAAFVLLNMVAIGRLLRSKTDYTEQKATSYECGEPTFGGAFIRFDLRFYVICLVFVIFDVEVLFLFPWAASLKSLGWFAFVEAVVFIAILAVGLAYVWRKGDVDWTPTHGREAQRRRAEVERLPAPDAPDALQRGVGTVAVSGPAAPVEVGA